MKHPYSAILASRQRRKEALAQREQREAARKHGQISDRMRAASERMLSVSTNLPTRSDPVQSDPRRFTSQMSSLRNNPENPLPSKSLETILSEDEHASDIREPTCLADSIRRMVNPRPETRNFLPIAKPRPDPPQDSEENNVNFEAPPDIEVRMQSTSTLDGVEFVDDAVTDVSELSIHSESLNTLNTLNTLGTYTQKRMSDRLAQVTRLHPIQAMDHYEMTTTRTRIASPQKRSAFKRSFSASPRNQLERVAEEKSSNYMFYQASSTLNQNTNGRDGTDAQKNTPIAVQSRHGLPYETTDFVDEEEASVDTWDKRITPKSATERNRLNNALGASSEAQFGNSATPRLDANDHIFNKLRETFSAEGSLIIDITEIADEDIDNLSSKVQAFDQTKNVSASVTTDMAEMVAQKDSMMSSSDVFSRIVAPKDSMISSSDVFANIRDGPDRGTPRASETNIDLSLNEARDDHSGERQRSEYQPGRIQQQRSTPKEPPGAKENLLSSSFAFLQSVANDFGSKFQSIQNMAFIKDKEMDEMLGVIGKELENNNGLTAGEENNIVWFLGEELEKTACGIDRSHQNKANKKVSSSRSETMNFNFQCGADTSVDDENVMLIPPRGAINAHEPAEDTWPLNPRQEVLAQNLVNTRVASNAERQRSIGMLNPTNSGHNARQSQSIHFPPMGFRAQTVGADPLE